MKRNPKSKENPVGEDAELQEPVSTSRQLEKRTNYPRAKGKRDTFRPRFPEFHFSTSLYIDEAVKALEHYTAQANAPHPAPVTFECATEIVDSDRARFTLTARREDKSIAELTGTMQRWEGSRTRIDADAKFQAMPQKQWGMATLIDGVVILGIGLFALFLVLVLRATSGRPVSDFALAVVVVVSFISIAAWVISPDIKGRFQRTQLISATTPQRDLDTLTDVLTAAFKDYDIQWIHLGHQ